MESELSTTRSSVDEQEIQLMYRPKKVGSMRLFWYDDKTGQPRIAIGSPLMLAGTIPLCLIAAVDVYVQVNGLL